MKLVSKEIDNAIEANKNAPSNFGLVFNKWLVFDGCEPIVKRNKQPLIDSYEKSGKKAEEILKQRHIQQAEYCRAMEQMGWRPFIVHARLTSSFVSGLGMTHPTETGMVLDHTSGLPYIPAASQKGVLRMAHVINSLLDDTGNWQNLDTLFAQGILREEKNKKTHEIETCWQEDDTSKTLFGFSEKKDSLAGQLVVLDAYPLAPPALGEEILNPHFMKYYSGERGPTEDQSPIPVKFLVVKSGADFVFRLLLRLPLDKTLEKDQEQLAGLIEKNLLRAIREEGMGAKTSLGFGRFEKITTGEPEKIQGWLRKQQEDEEQKKYPWRPTIRKIESVTDWGQLRQLLDNMDVQGYQAQAEVSLAVEKAASRMRKDNPKKWDDTRDNLLAEWLKPSGTVWSSLIMATAPVTNSLTLAEQAAMEQIEKLTDWESWQKAEKAGVTMESLPLPALKKLREKFTTLKIKDGKGDKPAIWRALNKLIKQR